MKNTGTFNDGKEIIIEYLNYMNGVNKNEFKIYISNMKTPQSRRLLQGLIKQLEIEFSCDISTGQYQSSAGSDEDWYWPAKISQLNSISRCLIGPCKSLLDCNVFNLIYFDMTLSKIDRTRFLQWFFYLNFAYQIYIFIFFCVQL